MEYSRRFEGKVVFITGAARGQGRSHALRYAAEGADIIATDICGQIDSLPAAMSTPEDLAETVRLVEALDRRIVAQQADVRDYSALKRAVDSGLAEFGKIDVVVANAGIVGEAGPFWEESEQSWHAVLDTNVMGPWNTVKAAAPAMIEAGNGGSVVMISSVLGLKAYQNTMSYTASKHGMVGVMRVMAKELAPHSIRVNTIHPTNVNTGLFVNDVTKRLFVPDVEPEDLTDEEFELACRPMNLLPIGWVEPEDITAAVTWITSDEAKYVTGVTLPVDAGCTAV